MKAKAGLEFDFYVVTKHLAVHRLYGLGLSSRAIATQMGWSEGQVDKLLAVYGHKELVALREIDALYETDSDAIPTQPGGEAAP